MMLGLYCRERTLYQMSRGWRHMLVKWAVAALRNADPVGSLGLCQPAPSPISMVKLGCGWVGGHTPKYP